MPGMDQARKAVAREPNNVWKHSAYVGVVGNAQPATIGIAADAIKLRTISLMPYPITAPMAFSPKKAVCLKVPKGIKIKATAAIM